MEVIELKKKWWSWILPPEKFTIKTRLSPTEIVQRLVEAIEPRLAGWARHPSGYYKAFEGEVTGPKFQLRRTYVPPTLRLFPIIQICYQPFVFGEIDTCQEESSVQVQIRMEADAIGFWILVLAIPLIVLGIDIPGMADWGKVFISMLLLVLVGAIPIAIFRSEALVARAFLLKLLAD